MTHAFRQLQQLLNRFWSGLKLHDSVRLRSRRRALWGRRGLAQLEDRTLLAAFVVNSAADDTTSGDGLMTLHEAIIAANAAGAGPNTITFGDGSGSGGTNFLDGTPDTILLTLGQLNITTSLTITGNGAANTIIDGGCDGVAASGVGSRMFFIDDGTNTRQAVTISGVTLQHGYTPGDGGAIFNSENLTTTNVTIAHNWAAGFGDGVYNGAPGTFTSTNDTIANNSACRGGGV
jgi:hypothetical protein